MEEIKRNIVTFLGILNVGQTESVSHWDESNFQRAEQWAKYAEEVYKKLLNKSTYKNVLCNYITQESSAARNRKFVFESLKNARETMQRILLQNPHLTSTQFAFVLNMYKVDFVSPSCDSLHTLFVDVFNISQSKGTFTILSSIKEKLKENIEFEIQGTCEQSGKNKAAVVNACIIPSKNNIQTTRDVIFDTCARLLWKHLQTKDCSSHELESELDLLINKFNNGTEIIWRMLLVTENVLKYSSNECKDEVQIVQSHIASWIIDKSPDIFIKTLYNSSPVLRSSILSEYPQFCELFLNYLKLRGDDLCNSSKLNHVIEDNENFGSSYRHLVHCFNQLFQIQGCVSDTCKKCLEQWRLENATQNDLQSGFWAKVQSEISKLQNCKITCKNACQDS